MDITKRPSGYIEMCNILSNEYKENLKLVQRKKKVNYIEYISEENEKLLVSSVTEIIPNVLEHMDKHLKATKSRKSKFNIAIDGVMNSGKTTFIKKLHEILHNERKDDVALITVTGYNLLCYDIMANNTIDSENGSYTIDYQKLFVGNDGSKPEFKDIKNNALMTNLNNLHRVVEDLEAQGREYIIIFDECHTLFTEHFYRNSKISKHDSERIMERFERIINEGLDEKSKNKCRGMIWCSATMDVFNKNEDYIFTKVYDINLTKEHRVYTDLLKPITLKGDKVIAKVMLIAKWLKENENNNSILSIYLNSKSEIDKIVSILKQYVKLFDINVKDLDLITAIVHADNVENNQDIELMHKGEIRDDVKLIFATSYMNAGINLKVKNRAVDAIIFADKKTFTLVNEIQFTGRFRYGTRILMLVLSNESVKTKSRTYKTFRKKAYEKMEGLASKMIEFIEQHAQTYNMDLENSKDIICANNPNQPENPGNHICLKDGKYIISKTAINSAIFLLYQRNYVLASMDLLIDAIYNHKSMNIRNIAMEEFIDYSEHTYESLGLDKSITKKKVTTKKANEAIKDLNALMNIENKECIEKALITGDINYIDCTEIDKNYEEIKEKVSIIIESRKYKASKKLITKSKKKNEKVIKDLLNTDVKIEDVKMKSQDKITKILIEKIKNAPVGSSKIEKELLSICEYADTVLNPEVLIASIGVMTQLDFVLGKINGKTVSDEQIKKPLFERLAYAGVLREEICGFNIEWSQDGTPSTQFDSTNDSHSKLIMTVINSFFNVNKNTRGKDVFSSLRVKELLNLI